MTPLLEVEHLQVHFQLPGDGWLRRQPRLLRAVDDISFSLQAGQTLGIVGESGCGKSTLARAILGLAPISGGQVKLRGKLISHLPAKALRPRRRLMQVVFQDPLASLDPRMTVAEIIAEPLQVFEPQLSRKQRRIKVQAMMERVGLLANQINRYPHEFSGGQCQRMGIARALICGPELLICDEPVSALDVSIQAQVINLLMEVQQDMKLSLLFIAHDLAVVKQISHEVMVMYLGQVVEQAPREQLYGQPAHPYSRALLDSIPIPDPRIERQKQSAPLQGDLPSPLNPPSGCRFHTRCPLAQDICRQQEPLLAERTAGHLAKCHLPVDLPTNNNAPVEPAD